MARYQKKAPVQLRRKKLKNGSESLYLDIYKNGVRMYEYLKLYLNRELTPKDRAQNRKVLELAQEICNKRIIEVQTEGLPNKSPDRFVDFVEKMEKTKKKRETITNIVNRIGFDLKLYQLNKEYMKRVYNEVDCMCISDGSKRVYYATFVAFVKKLMKKEYIKEFSIPANDFRFRRDSRRMFLSLDEVRAFAKVKTNNELESNIKRLFMFCCLTGLRFVDAHQIRYGDFEEINGRIRLNFRQQKTMEREYYDLTDNVRRWIGTGRPGDLVFNITHKSNAEYNALDRLVKRAGINKHITFHCARHTFAVLMIDLGVDIYTTSKLLGHRSVATTQIYTKVLDKKKQSAVDLIPKI